MPDTGNHTDNQQETGWKRVWCWLRQHAQLKVVLPVVVGVGLIAYVISIASAPQSAGQILQIVERTWWIVLLLIVPYLAIRFFIWCALLRQIQIKTALRPLAVAFAAGEITKVLPAGIYVENYLLARLEHLREQKAVGSSMSTSVMLGLESLIAVPVLLVIGLPGRAWIRWTVVGIVVAWVLLLLAAWGLVNNSAHHESKHTWKWVRDLTRVIDEFLESGGEYLTWSTLWKVVPTACYMLVYVANLYFITHAVGVQPFRFVDAMAVYAFMVLTVVLIPIPTELGLSELSSVAALTAFGIANSEAAIIALGLRALATGATTLVSALVLLFFRSELAQADHADEGQPAKP